MINKIITILKSNRLLILILFLGLFFRLYKGKELFLYAHDQDLIGWFVRDVVENKHIRLIGQETSTQGVFIGPIFYYLMIPFYFLGGWDPFYSTIFISLLGIFTIYSYYFVTSQIFNKKAGIIAAFLYSLSFYAIFNDREVVPTMPVMLWSVWFLYALHLLYKGNQKLGFLISGTLLGLIWHINVALVIVVPLLFIGFMWAKERLSLKYFLLGFLTFFVLVSPFIVFETRHGFIQVKAVVTSLSTNQQDIVSGSDKFVRVFHLASKNVAGLFFGSFDSLRYEYIFWSLLAFLGYLFYKNKIRRPYSIFMLLWVIIYLLFFSLYSKIVSEYYLNGLNVIWIIGVSVGISYLLDTKKNKEIGILLLIFFSLFNLDKFFHIQINESGYIQKKAVIAEIKRDSESRGYPCVALSYITKPGYEFGYRYFVYQAELMTKRPSLTVPVYTIVFPLNDKLFPVHKTFGAIGLIYPDYKSYTLDAVKESCVGENVNLIEPMFGLTS